MSTPRDSQPHSAGAMEMMVVGIGASAGGLDAISELLTKLPAQPGFPIMVVQHLGAKHESLLVDLLSRVTKLQVKWATEGEPLLADHVYVAPAHAHLKVTAGILRLEASEGRPATQIDGFFESLAAEARERAVGVILSGNGTDGTKGAKAIKEAGGIVFAQDERTAAFASMPRAAFDSGSVDRVLAPREIADELISLAESAPALWHKIAPSDGEEVTLREAQRLAAIYRLLLSRKGVDFSEYKQSTIRRRLVRQMALAKIRDLGEYVKVLQRDAEELNRLYNGLLIHVTEFFRDPEYFDFLRDTVFPDIIRQHRDGTPVRIWVPGCSTGEETYSVAIVLRELLEAQGNLIPVQIFGTDLSESAVAKARVARYPAAAVRDIAPSRLERFFKPAENEFVVHKGIRDMCIFARQNVVRESPFSHLDLIACRNLMIYLGPKAQAKLVPIFHFALNSDGYLMLGSSESIGAHASLFRPIDRRFRVYARKSATGRARIELALDPIRHPVTTPIDAHTMMSPDPKESFDVTREADRIIAGRAGPAGVLIAENLEILQFRGNVSPFLAPTEGRATLNLIRMAREGLGPELQQAVQQARDSNVRVRKQGVTVLEGAGIRSIDIDVTPITAPQGRDRYFLVLFTPAAPPPADAEPRPPPASPDAAAYAAQIEQLRQDLQATRRHLQATIEGHEAKDQELRAANEEIQSSNEELQSTNEELETAKEELQSTNEELTTINEELHSRQLELIQLNNDLSNLITSVHLPIVILAQDLRIRRFTPMAEKVLHLIPSDIGRPLTDLNINLNVKDLPGLITGVMESLTVQHFDVQDTNGHWYSMRLRPYKTNENKIDGVVLALIDVDEMKRAMAELESARDFARAVIDVAHEPLAALDRDLTIVLANKGFYQLLRTTPAAAQNRPLFESVQNPTGLGELRKALEGVLPNATRLTDYEVRLQFADAGTTRAYINARQIVSTSRTYPLILLSIREIETDA